MTTTINASTSTGLVSTADTSGIIKLQSNGVTTNALAWGRFSYSGSTITTKSTYNISSITYVSQGLFLIAMTNATTDANYSISGGVGDPTNTSSGAWFTYGYNVNTGGFTPTTTQFRIQIYYATANANNISDVSFVIFGN